MHQPCFSCFASKHLHYLSNTSPKQYCLLDIVLIFHGWLPQLDKSKVKNSFKSRFTWTVLVLVVFLIMEQFPMYGLNPITADDDYFVFLRSSILSTPGSLMELGLFPAGISTIVLFFIDDFFDLLEPNLPNYYAYAYNEDLRETAKSTITILLTLGISISYISSGLLKISAGKYMPFLVIIQLVISSSVISLLSQVLDEYGICGIRSLAITLQACREIFWQAFSPIVIHTEEGSMFEGSLLSLLHSLSSWPWESKIRALEYSFFRTSQPNLKTIGITILLFIFILYLKEIRIEIPVKLRKEPSIRGNYIIKLLYCEPNVLLFQYHFISEIILLSQVRHIFFPEINWRVLNFLGTWKQSQSLLVPISGLCYWLTPPTWSICLKDPLRISVYICYILLISALFSHFSVNNRNHKDNPETVIDDLLESTELTMAGSYEDSDEALRKEVRKLVSVAAILGGLTWGFVWILSDILEVNGRGQGMLLITEMVYGFYEAWLSDKKKSIA